jgi:histone H3/H4
VSAEGARSEAKPSEVRNMTEGTAFWKRCSSCKAEIGFERSYWVCSVSTCNRKRTGLVFCTVSCWDAHLPVMKHREAWAEERRSPSRAAWEREQAEETRAGSGAAAAAAPPPAREPQRRIAPTPARPREPEIPREVLVVVSKLKAYVKARSGMNTSDAVADVLSEKLRALCDEAIRRAGRDGRKTVMERDF